MNRTKKKLYKLFFVTLFNFFENILLKINSNSDFTMISVHTIEYNPPFVTKFGYICIYISDYTSIYIDVDLNVWTFIYNLEKYVVFQ